MKRFKSTFLVAAAVLVAGTQTLLTLPASAASSASISITPTKNYTIESGKSVTDKLAIRNLDAGAPLDLSLRVVDFTFSDDGGTPKLMLAQDAPQTTWSLKPFLTVPKTVSVPPKSSVTLDIGVAIPKGHGAGSYYSAIVYSSGSPVDGGNVGLSASGVTLVFASIPGNVNENLHLTKLGAYKVATKNQPAKYQVFTADQPETIAYTLKNDGNVTESPVGSITLKDMFGREQTINNVNPNGSLALIGQERTFTSCIKLKAEDVSLNGAKSKSQTCVSPGLWPGYYSVALNLFYGQNGNHTQEIVGKSSFWYVPNWSLAVLATVLLALAYVVWRVVRTVRRKVYGPQSKRPKNHR